MSQSKTYLMPFPIPYYRVKENMVACESALLEHLKLLKKRISPVFDLLLVAMPEMTKDDYEKQKNHLLEINEHEDKIYFVTLSQKFKGKLGFWLTQYPFILANLYRLVKNADYVHTGLSYDMSKPIGITAAILGILLKKDTCFVYDIDFRQSAWMNYQTKTWSRKSYLLCKYVYDPLRILQIKFAVKFCNLVLLKSRQMVRDFKGEKDNVKSFLNSAFSKEYVIDGNLLKEKIERIKSGNDTLEVVYFGRLVPYKGINLSLKAISLVLKQTNQNVRFHIIGFGEQKEDLVNLSKSLGIEKQVIFHDPIPYGQNLFDELYKYHLLLATPLSQDTPRSALDAMAAAVAVLAFDISYYKDLAEITKAIQVVPWLSVDKLAEQIIYLNENRNVLAEMMESAVDSAYENTQEKWLDKRWQWTLETLRYLPIKN